MECVKIFRMSPYRLYISFPVEILKEIMCECIYVHIYMYAHTYVHIMCHNARKGFPREKFLMLCLESFGRDMT